MIDDMPPANDPRFLDWLLTTHWNWICGVCKEVHRPNAQSIEDDVQDVCVQLSRTFGDPSAVTIRFESKARLLAFLGQLIRSRAIDKGRFVARRVKASTLPAAEILVQPLRAEPEYEPEDAKRLMRVLNDPEVLTQRQREVLVLRFSHQMTEKAAAEILDISQQSVHNHFVRARLILFEALGGDGQSHDQPT